ncbi:hypothetical protein QN345_13195 [Cryobacterium sp. 10I1]|uniref:hypothetical protein n=1 Tax=Cryobacterium sp. 10I1 TaxID=3048578 RepID=UPI002B225360|nr:hypothetical protein [Cryobacterium sp. 10I1]MEB0306259.1 hypothetical protein [Cryobacterium sp. 10I1]
MDLNDFDFSLRWPKELFLWEGNRIAQQKSDTAFINMVATLFSEAFVDGDIAVSLEQTDVSGWTPGPTNSEQASRVLTTLLEEPTKLHGFEPRKYWIERTVGVGAVTESSPLSRSFLELVTDLRTLNYFPKVLREQCVDDSESWELDPSHEISRAIHAAINWPSDLEDGTVSDDVLYSVIEYFHDQAQRPRTRWFHQFSGCGYHHNDHNKQSGAVVYRWYVNALLTRYGVGLRLGNTASEQGHLIRQSALSLDPLADQLAAAAPGTKTQDGAIADAIRLYRGRSSTSNQRRAAVTQLAGVVESQRQRYKEIQFASGDESDLFQIFNKFALRHTNKSQKGDYGDDYLDWIFWVTLSAIELLTRVAPSGSA